MFRTVAEFHFKFDSAIWRRNILCAVKRLVTVRDFIAEGTLITSESRTNRGFLSSFRHRSFRFQWTSDGLASWAQEIETLVLGWFVLTETNSPFLVGLVGALRFAGTLGGPFYGLIGDRFDRRRLLILDRTLLAGLATATFLLAFTGNLEAWHAFVIATALGTLRMFDNVIKQSLLADIVPRATLLNAVGLSRSMQDTAKITGALAGGAMLGRLGMPFTYSVVLSLYAMASLLAAGIGIRESVQIRATKSPVRNLTEGLGYVVRNNTIAGLMFFAFLVNLTGFPLTNGMMPVIARDVFNKSEEGLAMLLGVAAAGALGGSLLMAVVSRTSRPGRVMVIGVTAWHFAVLAFSQVDQFTHALVILLFTGFFSSVAMISMATMLLSISAPEYRGRVMGVRSLAVWGLQPGLLGVGFMASRFDIQSAFLLTALIGLGMTLFGVLKWPEIWRH